jgi:DNA repair protein RadC
MVIHRLVEFARLNGQKSEKLVSHCGDSGALHLASVCQFARLKVVPSHQQNMDEMAEQLSTNDWAQPLGCWAELSFPAAGEIAGRQTHYAAANLTQPEYTLRVRDMPQAERPRNRLFSLGPGALSTAELLALLLGTGTGSSHLSAVGLAQHLLQRLREGDADVLERLQRVTPEELCEIRGIGSAKAAVIIAAVELGKRIYNRGPVQGTVIDDPGIAASALSQQLMWEERELLAIVCLNIKHQILSTKVLTVGTPTETLAHPRDIFGLALRSGAARIIIAHNHPSGDISPSKDDIALTRQLLQGATVVGLPVLDHLILGQGNYRSLRQTTTLWQEEPQGDEGAQNLSVNEEP